MFKIESYVTPILLSYVDKYVRDFKPADAQLSLWGGGVALHNLVLKADVLQQEVALPFTLVSGRIHELLIQVPWTKIMSEPIVVTIDTIECVLSLNPPSPEDSPPPESPSRKTQVVEAPPGYMQALVRRIVSNIALRVHHLIVKYVQDDIVLSLNVKHVAVDSAGIDWEPTFADIDQNQPMIRRLVRLDDLTLCLDRADADGKIRFYQEPLLYRCQLDLRVLTRLVSANTRRASSLSIQLRSSKLAWGVTSDQLTLLLRLMREKTVIKQKQSPPAPKASNIALTTPLHATSSNSAEPTRGESWSDWAWSWLPTWVDREAELDETPMSPTPTPLHFAAYLDDVSFVFKAMEIEGGSRKRARSVVELNASYAAVKISICTPTTLRFHFGTRSLLMLSHGKCVCGQLDSCATNDGPTVYLRKAQTEETDENWKWPEDDFGSTKIETAEAIDEEFRPGTPGNESYLEKIDRSDQIPSDPGLPEEPVQLDITDENDNTQFWTKMDSLIYVEYIHDRSPPQAYTNPYDNPPKDFQYSDWSEECNLKVRIEPIEFRVCVGLLHRIQTIVSLYQDLPPVLDPELPMRTLTVEECESLSDNIPQRRISIELQGVRFRVHPCDHALTERPMPASIFLDIEVPKASVIINGPLYPHRVCSAACQMPDDSGPLWQGARLHVTAVITSLQAQISSTTDLQPRPCGRTDIRIVMHLLLNKKYFARRQSVLFSYSIKIREANVCGSAARLQAAWHVLLSLLQQKMSLPLRYTSLTKDALSDEDAVALDVTLEDLLLRGYITNNINTHLFTMQCARATAYHSPNGGELKQAWLFSAPDMPTTTPYLRLALQWCSEPVANSLDYVGCWMEPTAVCVDPLLIAWLAYKPYLRPLNDIQSQSGLLKNVPSTQYFSRRRTTPPSSSGRGASRSGSGAELVHVRPRSIGSSSEPSEKKDVKHPPQPVFNETIKLLCRITTFSSFFLCE